ncbi:hypothetical protein [Hahella sp. HN01]|uniref:hypothetical protein n=1 Tax=Hahella sp. HN01 TaxID=2847262 RepID=UPI001C1F0A56|nr:hypothetical protein [Hahella sp. HN01]MBU6955035.1 hypothetical protein [Hahella sp. HN01]
MNRKVKWQKGSPKWEGIFLASTKFPNGLGENQLLRWKDNCWYDLPGEEKVPDTHIIVGFISTTEIVARFRGEWPEWDTEE